MILSFFSTFPIAPIGSVQIILENIHMKPVIGAKIDSLSEPSKLDKHFFRKGSNLWRLSHRLDAENQIFENHLKKST